MKRCQSASTGHLHERGRFTHNLKNFLVLSNFRNQMVIILPQFCANLLDHVIVQPAISDFSLFGQVSLIGLQK